MTPAQRSVAEKLAKWHQAMADEPNRNGAKKEKHAITADLLRELAAEPCGYDETTGNCTQNPCCRAEPQVEPVAWWCKWPHDKGGGGFMTCDKRAAEGYMRNMAAMDGPELVPLYAHPTQRPLTDGPHINCWALREVWFDEQGEPGMHRDPPPPLTEERTWTLLLVGPENGLVGKRGEPFLGAPGHHERVNVRAITGDAA